MPIMWDLCSGLGGASLPFTRDSEWEVHRIENNLEIDAPFTHHLDVLEWIDWFGGRDWDARQPDLIWASPPCLEFSRAFNAPAPTALREGRPFSPNLDVVQACKDLIDFANPKYWVIENVMGAKGPLEPILGTPTQILGPFVLWGHFPRIVVPRGWSHSKYDVDSWSSDPLRANKRALIPLTISQGLKDSVELQQSILSWCEE
jgi:hypothetical protein